MDDASEIDAPIDVQLVVSHVYRAACRESLDAFINASATGSVETVRLLLSAGVGPDDFSGGRGKQLSYLHPEEATLRSCVCFWKLVLT